MANPIDPHAQTFRAELDDGQVVEADGTTITDPVSGSAVPAVLLRMSPARAHTLGHVLDDWSRVALVLRYWFGVALMLRVVGRSLP